MDITNIDRKRAKAGPSDSEILADIANDMRKARRYLGTIRDGVIIIALIMMGVTALALLGLLGALMGLG